MFNLEKALSSAQVQSRLLEKNLAYCALIAALGNKDIKAVEKALEKMGNNIQQESRKSLQDACMASDWPEGFEKLITHFKFEKNKDGDWEDLYEERLLWLCLDYGSLALAKHFWPQSSNQARQACLEDRVGLEVAQILMLVGDEKRLRVIVDNDNDKDQELKGLMKKSLEFLNQSQRKGGASADGIGTGEEKVRATESIIKVLLSAGNRKMISYFWKEMCLQDNVEVFKKLVSAGVVKKELYEINEAPSEFLSRIGHGSGRQKMKLPKWWLEKWAGIQKIWLPEAQSPYNFRLADIVCLYSRGALSIASQLVADSEFRRELCASPFACHAFVCATSQSFWGTGLWDELKIRGVNLSEITSDSGQNPLHQIITEYSGRQRELDLIDSFARLYPQWVETKDDAGKTPLEYAGRDYYEVIKSVLEKVVITGIIKKRAGAADPEFDGVGRKHRV